MKKTTLAFLALFGIMQTFAQYGAPDPTFGVNGIATFDSTPNSNNGSWGYGGCMQSDGKIIIVGSVYTNAVTKDDFVMMRLNENGTLDTTFGNQGIFTTDFLSRDNMFTTAIQLPDGRILGVGNNFISNTNDIVLVMLNANGTLDTSYGTNGFRIVGSPSLVENAYEIIRLQSGKYLISGVQYNSSSPQHAFALFRFNEDLTPDTTFGTNGIKTFPEFSNGDSTPISETPEGDIIFSTYNMIVSLGTWMDFVVVKVHADGSMDTSFGTNGQTRIDITGTPGQTDIPYAQMLQSDGKIVVSGKTWLNQISNTFSICRLNANGSLDTTFGNGGRAHFVYGNTDDDVSYGVTQRLNGKYVIGGSSDRGNYADYALLFLNEDGTPDANFGTNGLVRTNISGLDIMTNMFEREDGKIVLIGETGNFGGAGFTAVRYTVEPNLSTAENPLENVSPYPNPAKSQLFVNVQNLSEAKATLYDMTGRALSVSTQISNGQLTLSDLGKYPAGTYVLQLQSAQGSKTWKILH